MTTMHGKELLLLLLLLLLLPLFPPAPSNVSIPFDDHSKQHLYRSLQPSPLVQSQIDGITTSTGIGRGLTIGETDSVVVCM